MVKQQKDNEELQRRLFEQQKSNEELRRMLFEQQKANEGLQQRLANLSQPQDNSMMKSYVSMMAVKDAMIEEQQKLIKQLQASLGLQM